MSDLKDLSPIAGLNLIYRSGSDRAGLPLIVFAVGNLPTYDISFDDVFVYLARVRVGGAMLHSVELSCFVCISSYGGCGSGFQPALCNLCVARR